MFFHKWHKYEYITYKVKFHEHFFIGLPALPFVRPFVHPSTSLFVLPIVRPSIDPSVRFSIHPYVRPFVRPSVRSILRRFVGSSVRYSFGLWVRPSVLRSQVVLSMQGIISAKEEGKWRCFSLPRVTNLNILFKISIHHQEMRLWELVKGSPGKNKMLWSFILFSKLISYRNVWRPVCIVDIGAFKRVNIVGSKQNTCSLLLQVKRCQQHWCW